ncbi:MAG: CDP-glycerol glycerophosphotransferase family protein [Gammaproteobacteria bacterium]|nr:CDP-glycerol glycerophosphotransferase family protein [Gammaproteobacteria bacterium]
MEPRRYLLYITQNYSFAILRPLQQAIRARGDSVTWFLFGKDINADYLRDDETCLSNIKQVKDYSPCAVFVTGNVVPDFFPGIKVTVFHGFDARKRANDDHFFIRDYFDLYCTQGPDTTVKYQQLAKKHGDFRVVETGWSKLDPLFDSNTVTTNNEKPVILYSSTFTKKLTSAPQLLETIKNVSKNDRYKWIITFHPKMDKSIVDAYKNIQNENLEFIETDDIIPLLLEADVMLCDTSSILQEFLVLNKPVVTFNNRLPDKCMINVTSPEEVFPALETALSKPADLMKKIQEYSDQLHPYRDGHSSERVLDAVDWFIREGHQGLKHRSLSLMRKIKIRKEFGYYWL